MRRISHSHNQRFCIFGMGQNSDEQAPFGLHPYFCIAASLRPPCKCHPVVIARSYIAHQQRGAGQTVVPAPLLRTHSWATSAASLKVATPGNRPTAALASQETKLHNRMPFVALPPTSPLAPFSYPSYYRQSLPPHSPIRHSPPSEH